MASITTFLISSFGNAILRYFPLYAFNKLRRKWRAKFHSATTFLISFFNYDNLRLGTITVVYL